MFAYRWQNVQRRTCAYRGVASAHYLVASQKETVTAFIKNRYFPRNYLQAKSVMEMFCGLKLK